MWYCQTQGHSMMLVSPRSTQAGLHHYLHNPISPKLNSQLHPRLSTDLSAKKIRKLANGPLVSAHQCRRLKRNCTLLVLLLPSACLKNENLKIVQFKKSVNFEIILKIHLSYLSGTKQLCCLSKSSALPSLSTNSCCGWRWSWWEKELERILLQELRNFDKKLMQ